MANGDIDIGTISETEFKSYEQDHQTWLLLKGLQSLSTTCHGRPAECKDVFVSQNWFKTKLAFVSGFASAIAFIGIGLIGKLFGFLK